MDHEILIFSLRAIISYINPARVINLIREDIVHATYRNALCKLAKDDKKLGAFFVDVSEENWEQ